MNCKFCGFTNEDGSKYCENCGAAIEITKTDDASLNNGSVNATAEPVNTVEPVNTNTAEPVNTIHQPEEPVNAPQNGYQPYQQNVSQNGYQPYNPNGYQPYTPSQYPPYASAPETQPAPANGLAIASLVCGIISILCCGYLLGVLAIVFGVVAKAQGNRGGLATAGIVCGIVGLGIWLLFLLAAM